MPASSWNNLYLSDGVLREPTPDDNQIVLWLPQETDGRFRIWQRISNVPGAATLVQAGIHATPATAMRARQHLNGFFGRLFRRFTQPTGTTWLLPNGDTVDQCGDRQTDLMLVWAENAADSLAESSIKSFWPESKQVMRIGKGLFLVWCVQPDASASSPAQPQGPPRQELEQQLSTARQTGDLAGQLSALADLGAMHLEQGNARAALPFLQEALPLCRQLGDRTAECDVLGNLGMALLADGQRDQAPVFLEQELACARAAGDPFAEKNALEHLGYLRWQLHDPAQAISLYEQALASARRLSDRSHKMIILWSLAIQHAALGQRDRAIEQAQAVVDHLKQTADPRADWCAGILQKYRVGNASAWPPEGSGSGLPSSMGSKLASPAGQAGAQSEVRGARLLNMALSALTSLAKFIGSGFKTVTAETHHTRLQACAACPYHTGRRCRVCGCFTVAKAWLPLEHCPIGKWPAVEATGSGQD